MVIFACNTASNVLRLFVSFIISIINRITGFIHGETICFLESVRSLVTGRRRTTFMQHIVPFDTLAIRKHNFVLNTIHFISLGPLFSNCRHRIFIAYCCTFCFGNLLGFSFRISLFNCLSMESCVLLCHFFTLSLADLRLLSSYGLPIFNGVLRFVNLFLMLLLSLLILHNAGAHLRPAATLYFFKSFVSLVKLQLHKFVSLVSVKS
ncbi:membrane protein [gut metagenome]|uniref:Membrane protein n=1 Tax=gut metagenome TaxID=749906 RepID=J9G8K2_9ZZZZ